MLANRYVRGHGVSVWKKNCLPCEAPTTMAAMKRDIEWTEKLEDGTKRIVRVNFFGDGKILWKFKSTGQERWDNHSAPSEEDWSILEGKVKGRHNRCRSTLIELELVRALRKKHG
jgi:hypothetical protein